jgi:glycosyltransferase involved in cell wall biosynthesis
MKGTVFYMLERLLSGIGRVVAVSRSEKITLERFLPHAKVAVAWCGVVSDELSVREIIATEDGEMRLVFSGRLNYQKNPEMFMRVAIRLLGMFPTLRVYMIGAGYHDSESQALRARLSKSGLTSRVSILDWLPAEENREIMQAATVVVLTSRFESFGYVVAEAMAMKIPVVATKVDGPSDLIVPGETGFLVDVDDDDSMVEHITTLLRSPLLRSELGRNGCERIKAHFEANAGVSELSKIYLSL